MGADNRPQVYLTTPYGSTRKGLDVLAELKPEAVQVDLSVGTLALDEGYLDRVKNLKSHVVAGLIDGRNVWAANLRDLRSKYEDLEGSLDSLSVSTSVSLQHVPHTVEAETKLPADVATWFSFANEKVKEVVALSQGPLEAPEAYSISDRAVRTRAESERIHNAAVKARIEKLPAGEVKREPAFAERNEAQKELGLPQLPTTTIGSFPQTKEIRQARAAHRKGASASMSSSTASRSAMTWFSTLPSCSMALSPPKTAGSSLMAPAAPVRQSLLVTSPARLR